LHLLPSSFRPPAVLSSRISAWAAIPGSSFFALQLAHQLLRAFPSSFARLLSSFRPPPPLAVHCLPLSFSLRRHGIQGQSCLTLCHLSHQVSPALPRRPGWHRDRPADQRLCDRHARQSLCRLRPEPGPNRASSMGSGPVRAAVHHRPRGPGRRSHLCPRRRLDLFDNDPEPVDHHPGRHLQRRCHHGPHLRLQLYRLERQRRRLIPQYVHQLLGHLPGFARLLGVGCCAAVPAPSALHLDQAHDLHPDPGHPPGRPANPTDPSLSLPPVLLSPTHTHDGGKAHHLSSLP
ncbi:uncharacterized protein BJ171DRAFT_51573, partial [Polychytrium aggregatum]|uniref:uncharacterized protein n=1 Tax=Polychytrium aggregatum TaxID=110093 RepID=UPI0022FE16A1